MKRFVWAVAVAAMMIAGAVPVAQAQDRSIGERVDDAMITTQLKAKLALDSAKSLVNVDVDTRDGVVHLKGMVPSDRDRMEAERLARATKGVRDVRNDISVARAGDVPRDRGAASPPTR